MMKYLLHLKEEDKRFKTGTKLYKKGVVDEEINGLRLLFLIQ